MRTFTVQKPSPALDMISTHYTAQKSSYHSSGHPKEIANFLQMNPKTKQLK